MANAVVKIVAGTVLIAAGVALRNKGIAQLGMKAIGA